MIVQSELEGVGIITRQQMSRRIKQMKNHYIVCGYGRIGGTICAELEKAGFPFVLIETNDALLADAEKLDFCFIRGNATADSSLSSKAYLIPSSRSERTAQ